MRIGLNLLYLLPNVVGGTETYARHLLQELAALDPSNEYVIFLNKESSDLQFDVGTNFTRIVCPVTAKSRGARYAWEQLLLPRELREHRITVLHSLGYVGPINSPCRHVVTIHDLNFASPHVHMSRFKRRVLGSFVVAVGRRADHILTLSHCSKAQIVERLGVNEDRVTTTHLAPDSQIRRDDAPANASDGPRGSPYVVVFGGSAPHKNIPRLIQAFASVCDRVPHKLVILGHAPKDGSIASAIANCSAADRIITTGYLPSTEMASTLAGADLLVFPSLYEGFGLPVLDAQAAGVPVVCSSAAALPEVAGDGAALFDPLSVESMAQAILSPLIDRSVHSRLLDAGSSNVRKFSWRHTATLTLSAYERAAAAPTRRVGIEK